MQGGLLRRRWPVFCEENKTHTTLEKPVKQGVQAAQRGLHYKGIDL